MKRYILLVIVCLLMVGCDNEDKNNTKDFKNDKINVDVKIDDTYEYVDDNPIGLGMYIYTNSWTDRRLTDEYSTDWTLNVDLCSLEVYFTNDLSIPGTNQKQIWNTYYSNYSDIDNYRIGYEIKFTTNEGEISKTILSPNDVSDIYDYMQIYLYDDINQNNGWYDHVDSDEYDKNTMLTSIKLTGSTKTHEIISDITLTAFTYDISNNDDFDYNNNYRGISKFSTVIKRS